MSDSNPAVKKTLLLEQMEADRVALVTDHPPRVASDFRLSPELKPWAIPAALFAVSMLKMPPAIKAPLRALAMIMLKNRVQEVVRVAQSGDRNRPVTARIPERRERPLSADTTGPLPAPIDAPARRDEPGIR
ncbi:MAG: hypothetical protein JHC61_04365 [Burkholderiaceae bacterium]|nr:hypothetical protein [Burkholderiaceae bacterium]